MVTSCEIRFDNNSNATFQSGQTLTGTVVLSLTEKKKFRGEYFLGGQPIVLSFSTFIVFLANKSFSRLLVDFAFDIIICKIASSSALTTLGNDSSIRFLVSLDYCSKFYAMEFFYHSLTVASFIQQVLIEVCLFFAALYLKIEGNARCMWSVTKGETI